MHELPGPSGRRIVPHDTGDPGTPDARRLRTRILERPLHQAQERTIRKPRQSFHPEVRTPLRENGGQRPLSAEGADPSANPAVRAHVKEKGTVLVRQPERAVSHGRQSLQVEAPLAVAGRGFAAGKRLAGEIGSQLAGGPRTRRLG